VEGQAARRAVAFSDLTQPEAARLASERLDRLGVDQALIDAGAKPGDEVRVGDLIMEFRVNDEEDED
jgi:GTP-binding protein